MKWYLNELSLTGQFATTEHFIEHLKNILSLRERFAIISNGFYCPRGLPEVKVSGERTFRDAVINHGEKNLTRKVVLWLDRNGPFTAINNNKDIVCEWNGKNVDGTTLAQLIEFAPLTDNLFTYSFDNSNPSFSLSPLRIDYFTGSDDEIKTIDVNNHWKLDVLEAEAKNFQGKPESWEGFCSYIYDEFPFVNLSVDVFPFLKSQPFSSVICERGIFLVRILNEYVASRNDDGSYSDKTNEILKKHFSGERAIFTDESKTNKERFHEQMTYNCDGEDVLCSWHGKISYRFYRMHFEYPIVSEKNKINIVYFGPKITKG